MKNDHIEQIRSILLSFWDPLNVGLNNNLRDEYDDVIETILELKNDKISAEEVFNILVSAEADYETENIDKTNALKVANKIVHVLHI